jgi:hypothetical protein
MALRLRINVTIIIILKIVSGPILPNEEGIVLKLEKMQVEELYHCIYDGIVYLFYKDSQNFLHCYEIGNKQVVSEIEKHPDDLKDIIKKYSIDIKSQ